jgi:hypothetical protein
MPQTSLMTLNVSFTLGSMSLPSSDLSRPSITFGAVTPRSEMRAPFCSACSSTRSPYHWGTKSSVSGLALSMRTRFRYGSKYATSTNLAPRL